jgi:predicted DNA-binding transcriptional regulator YafY
MIPWLFAEGGAPMKDRKSRIARILSTLDLLDVSSEGLSLGQIHRDLSDRGFEASPRTIHRDLVSLSEAGFPLIEEGATSEAPGAPDSRWSLSRVTGIHPYLVLTAKELFALYLARGVLRPLEHTPFYEDLHSIFRKLEEKIGPERAEQLEALEGELRFDPSPAWGLSLNPDVLEILRAACRSGKVIEARYHSVRSGSESVRRLGPHYLYYAQGGLYLVAEELPQNRGETERSGRVKAFALPRFRNAAMLDEAYEGRIVTPREFLNGALKGFNGSGPEDPDEPREKMQEEIASEIVPEVVPEIVVEFDSDVAHHIRERRWHASQRVMNLDRGRVRVTLELESTPGVIAWILGFGPSARVLSPANLAEQVATRASETLSLYQRTLDSGASGAQAPLHRRHPKR